MKTLGFYANKLSRLQNFCDSMYFCKSVTPSRLNCKWAPVPTTFFSVAVERNKNREQQIVRNQTVSPEKKYIQLDGFIYLSLKLAQREKPARLGLMLKDGATGIVYVYRVSHGSIAAEKLFPCDRILDIDSTEILDKEAAKKIILQKLSESMGSLIMIVERPVSSYAREIVADAVFGSASNDGETN